jgi:PIN domain nuclease of toxin-antitoxin system
VVPLVRYLLDTHAWVWAVLADRRLGARARRALARLESGERVGLAAISLKEAAWHLARGRIVLAERSASWAAWLREAASAAHLEILPLTVEVAIESEGFPPTFTSDPADRLIAATARIHDLTLLTGDRAMRKSPELRTLW